MTDVFGQALLDYVNGNYSGDILTYSSLDEEDRIPLPYLFRNFKDMPPLEKRALQLCKGKVLDVGCGSGSHSLYLQSQGLDVTALDRSPGAVETCRRRGIQKTVQGDIHRFKGQKFDTLLFLMNGIGIVGRYENLGPSLGHFKSLLNTDGQIILDSSDIIYMFDEGEDSGRWIPDNGAYYGQVDFLMEYRGQKGEPFSWLYLDFNTLQRAAHAQGLSCECVEEGEHYDYLAILRPF